MAADDWCATIKENFPGTEGTTLSMLSSIVAPEDVKLTTSFKPFEDCTGAKIAYDGTQSFEEQVKVRVASGNPPDIALMPQPGLLKSIVESSGSVIPVPQLVADNVDKYYSPAFKGYGTVNDIFFAPPMDANVKSFVWYSPKTFKEKGYEVPQTYDELVALSDKIAATGEKPWCAGIFSDAATGWPATDWLEDFMLRENGPDVYDQWITNDVKFNDPMVAAALAKVGTFLKNEKYVNGGFGGVETIASTKFQEAGVPITQGKCYLHRQASFYENNWPAGTTVAPDGDVYAFYLPPFNDKFGKPVLGAGTFAAAFADNNTAKAFQYYLTTPFWSNKYIETGTNITANKELDGNNVKSSIGKLSVDILQDPDAVFRFDASDLMPAEVGSGAEWKQFTAWISPGQSDQVTLDNIQAAWPAG